MNNNFSWTQNSYLFSFVNKEERKNMTESPIGKSAWNLTAAFYCLSKEKDLFGPHQVENINCGFFVLAFWHLDKYFYAVYSARTLPRVTGKELIRADHHTVSHHWLPASVRAAPANAALNWPPLLEQQANSFLVQFAGYKRSPSKEPRIERMASWLIHFALFYAFCQATSGFIWEQHNKGQQNYQDRKFLHKLSVTLITNLLFTIIFSVNCDDLLHKLKVNFITAQLR